MVREEHRRLRFRPPPGSLAAQAQSIASKHTPATDAPGLVPLSEDQIKGLKELAKADAVRILYVHGFIFFLSFVILGIVACMGLILILTGRTESLPRMFRKVRKAGVEAIRNLRTEIQTASSPTSTSMDPRRRPRARRRSLARRSQPTSLASRMAMETPAVPLRKP